MSVEQEPEQAETPSDAYAQLYDHAKLMAITTAEQLQQEGRMLRPTEIQSEEEQDDHFDFLNMLYQNACQQLGVPWPRPVDDETGEWEQLKPLFLLGQIVATPGALDTLENAGKKPAEFLIRHVTGDWGELAEEDIQENELSVEEGFRILSSYPLSETEETLWIITEHDRSATTLLRPDEY